MLVDELSIRDASKEELEIAQAELDMYPVLTDHEIYMYEMIDRRLSEFENIESTVI